jgi:hypothetical protein
MRPILENIFRFLVNKLELFLYDGLFFLRCKKMNESMNQRKCLGVGLERTWGRGPSQAWHVRVLVGMMFPYTV